MPKKLTIEQFIERSIKLHKNKYDYSDVIYVNRSTKVIIICPIHNEYLQKPSNHMDGCGCPKCGHKIQSEKNKMSFNDFILKAKNVHGDRYDYSKVNYINSDTKVKIKCSVHNEFLQLPSSHLMGIGCPKCGLESRIVKRSSTTEDFIEKAKKIHGNKYDYSKTIYKNSNTKVKIICKLHGIFEQHPYSHLQKQGCPICNESKGEDKIRIFLTDNNINYTQQKTFKECKWKRVLPFDFYLPDKNILIEFDGKQHFKSVKQWGGDEGFEIRKKRDQIKNKYAYDNNIKLIRIAYNESVEQKLLDLI